VSVHLAKGMRDHLPTAMKNRQHVIDTLRGVFSRFGFEPLETPAVERIETLTGKYGDEGDKLLFRIADNAIFRSGEVPAVGKICDQALRYDLTVPLARVVAMNPDLRLPFKRWQMQPVWRGDRPQRGRFREFWQCDVDIVGTTSPLADAECLAVLAAGLEALDFSNYRIRLNDRRILAAMVRAAGASDRETAVLVAIDKLDKIGRDGVTAELSRIGLDEAALTTLWSILDIPVGLEETLDALAAALDEGGRAGVDALREVLPNALAMGVPRGNIVIDATLARGLDYYTGPVYETEVLEPKIGSISGGGRYDKLVGMFSGRDVPAVGVSFGLERIITVMEELGRFGAPAPAAKVLVAVWDKSLKAESLALATQLRAAGVATELYLDDAKLQKQMKYANERGYPYVALIGPDEAKQGVIALKDLRSGAQELLGEDEIIARLT
jgi:histidyl-tRNA synthetase